MKSIRNILIISYVFPPYPGVGGRRWSKFAKYLYRSGYNVFVIAAKNPYPQKSLYLEDIQELPSENLYYLPALYPTALFDSTYSSILSKVYAKIWILTMPFITKGNWADRALLWKYQIKKTTTRVIKNFNIDVAIISTPPFHYAYHLLQEMEIFKNVVWVIDYRDPIDLTHIKNNNKIAYEMLHQEKVIKKADLVITPDIPNTIIPLETDKLDEKISSKIFQIPHGYDEDDFIEFESNFMKIPTEDLSINISHFGSLYVDLTDNPWLKSLAIYLDYTKNKEMDLYNRIFLEFYPTTNPLIIFSYLKNHNDRIKVYNPLPPKFLFKKLSKSNFILDFSLGDNLKSKFPEFIFMRKPLIAIGYPSEFTKTISKLKMGFYLDLNSHPENFIYAIKNPQLANFSSPEVENLIKELNYKTITKRLIEILDAKWKEKNLHM